jgi:prepilin-type N-terminal cleavage/methylation domain-containing protein
VLFLKLTAILPIISIKSIAGIDMPRKYFQKRVRGFSLAELLVALMILAEIATFTIPKVLSAQQNTRYKAIGHEAIAAMTTARIMHESKGLLTSGTTPKDLFQYINYLKYDTSSQVDDLNGNGAYTCSAASPCVYLQSGGVINADSGSFGGTGSTNAVSFFVDPKAGYSNTTSGNEKSAPFVLYYNGRITSYDNILPGTQDGWGAVSGSAGQIPPWFNWN